MASHNKLTFTAEYCRSRRIPYRIKREALFIAGKQICFSLYNLTYGEILTMIDKVCQFDPYSMNYSGYNTEV